MTKPFEGLERRYSPRHRDGISRLIHLCRGTYIVALFSTILSVNQAGDDLLATAPVPGLAPTLHYTASRISEGRFNPAVTLGLVAGGRFPFGRADAGLHQRTIDRGNSRPGSLHLMRCEGIATGCKAFLQRPIDSAVMINSFPCQL